MKKSKDYLEQLETLSENTDYVYSDNLYNVITASFAYWNSALAQMNVRRAEFYDKTNVPMNNGKMPSVASIEKQWDATPDGKQLILLKAEVDNLKALAKAVDNHNFNLRAEVKLSH